MLKKDKKVLKGLNSAQIEAVTWGDGPLLIIAGAGTGKTKVITHRIAWLIASKCARPEEILGLTYTDKAADEMEERVDILVPYGWVPVQISTFHSFGQRILRDYAFEFGIDPDFRVLATLELLVFLKEHLFELPLDYFRPLSHPTKYLQALLDVISRAKDEDVTAEKYLEYAESKLSNVNSEEKEEATKWLEVAKCYQKYEDLLIQHSYLDMASLITLPLKFLREKTSVLKELQSKFKYILVDEFQDTNYAQFQLLKLLSASHRNITVVGDDDQSIYKFRGACLANILSFRETYPDAHEVILNTNYRSTQSILDTAHRLIVFNNPNRLEVKANIDKRIVGMKPEGPEVTYFHYDTASNEADGVAEMIKKKLAQSCKYNDFAILVRTNRLALPFLKSLNMQGIPWTFSGNQGLYDQEEIKILISLLNVLSNIEDSQSLYYLINSPVYGLNPLDLSKCLGLAKKRTRSLYWVFTNLEDIDISTESKTLINKFLGDISYLSTLSATQPTGKVLYDFLTRTGWLKKLTRHPSVKNELQIKNIAEFFKIIESISNVVHTDRVPFVIEHIESLKELGDNPPVAQADFDIDAVHILTVHKAKGLEFKVVFLVSLVSDIFPHRPMPKLVELPLDLVKELLPDLLNSEIHIQEERRLFYVGMTRAKEELILTSARDYGGRREKKTSPFVLESLDLSNTHIAIKKTESLEQINLFSKIKSIEANELKKTGILELSSTGIDNWLTCPLKYWYIHRLKTPLPKHHTIVYGNAIHKAIGYYLRFKKDNKKILFDELIKVFEDSWISEGFISRKHEEERFKKGIEVLRNFFNQGEEDNTNPLFVEERCSFLFEDVKVKGRWDRVDEGIIIDYKTGNVLTKTLANQRVRESVQLPIYALAYKERFGKFPERVEFHFVDTGIVGELKNIEKKVEKVKQTIKDVAREVRKGNFAPNPKYHACKFCPCRLLCSYTS
ncbi:ATP-dependent helicase [candidate division WOR-3 bacterium]|nr:ATP-dependent helicase [candidate division WOR-3 bacterium]